MRLFLIIFCFQLINGFSIAQSPQFDWARGINGKGLKIGYRLISDSRGNVICTGTYWHTSLTVMNSTFINRGEGDSFIVKYDSLGNTKWFNTIGGISADAAIEIVVDHFDNIVVTGYTDSKILHIGSYQLICPQGNYNAFTIKYDKDGNLLWAKSFGGIREENGQSIAIDQDNNIYTAGYFDSPIITFGNDTLINTSNIKRHFYIIKYDENGNELWAKAFDGDYNAQVIRINFDCSGNMLLSGAYSGKKVIIGNRIIINTSFSRTNSFLASIDNNTNINWLKSIEGDLDEYIIELLTDNQCNIYISGISNDKILKLDSINYNLDTVGDYKSFYFKFNSEGTLKWVKSFTMSNEFSCCPMALDLEGSVYISGGFNTQKYKIGGTVLLNKGGEDIYIVKLDSTSKELWVKSIGTYLEEEAPDITIDDYGNFYITGSYSSDTIYFDNNLLINTTDNDFDYFIAKLGRSTVSTINTEHSKINAFPNPADNYLQIAFDDIKMNDLEMHIFDVLGKDIITPVKWIGNIYNLSTKQLSNGVYFLGLFDGNKKYYQRIVVQH